MQLVNCKMQIERRPVVAFCIFTRRNLLNQWESAILTTIDQTLPFQARIAC
jgi:hypothetical protein